MALETRVTGAASLPPNYDKYSDQKVEDDVDIYADLPSFNLVKNVEHCKCEELKEELNSLTSKFEVVQKAKTNLENNLSSLLKTAKAEITRKDNIISNLRKQIDDMSFRRGFKNFTRRPHVQRKTATETSESIVTHSQESETEWQQIQSYHEEYKSKPLQIEVTRIPTLFGERLKKKIIEEEKEEKKQSTSKLNIETKFKDIPENSVVENDKENGSQFGVNSNKFNSERYSNSESSEKISYKRNSVKRTNEDDATHRHKRIKVENNENKTTSKESDYNYLVSYDLTNNSAQYKVKDDLIKLENPQNAMHLLIKKEEVPFCIACTTTSEDMKHDQSCTNRWKNDVKNNSTRDYDKYDHADSSKNSRNALISHCASEGFNNDYKKNEYRYSPSRRGSRNRSDYESSTSYRLRERSSRIHRNKKYDDYRYDVRHKDSRLKKSYESEEGDGKTRYRRGERYILRDRSRYSSSDTEDRESGSYKNKKYENRRIKKETNILNDKKLYKNNKPTTETNRRKSSSRTIANSTTDYSDVKNIDQHKVKNEKSEIKPTNSIESTSIYVELNDLNNLEEGEILDSPKKNNFTIIEDKTNKINNTKEINVKSVLIEDKNKNNSTSISVGGKQIQNNTINTELLEPVENNTKKIEVTSCFLQENSKKCKKINDSNSTRKDMAVDVGANCKKYEGTETSNINEDAMDSASQNIGAMEQVCDNDINGYDKNNTDTLKDFTIETTVAKTVEIKKTAVNIENATKIKELDNFNTESGTKSEELDKFKAESNIEDRIKQTEANNFNNSNNTDKIDSDELKNSKTDIKTEAALNCDIEDGDKSQEPIESNETCHRVSNRNNIETCLNDHNYVQNPLTNCQSQCTQKLSLGPECNEEIISKATSRETKVEKTVIVQSVNSSAKKTMSFITKNNKNEQNKGVLISHRRKAVTLSDSNASMTILMNASDAGTSSIINDCNDSPLKPRACKISRVIAKTSYK
ncbi:hypothetical protein PUN28_010789 [Cardiocondyla obscurior]|uniref:Uncharacterized protein n=1 Tax=Cardiocondyla obscurior TaxID=286306 RepID=A0AAW2FMZ2_9HYME